MTAIKTSEQLDEMRARAIHDADGVEGLIDWDKLPDRQMEGYLFVAKAIREVDERAGLVVVPREPTNDMLMAAFHAMERARIWVGDSRQDKIGSLFAGLGGMFSASPFAPKVTP